MESFDIVDLIENNPITSLSNVYQNRLLTKIKTKFTETEQQIFVASFYSFLNYNSKRDYVVDLDDVWKWVGYSNKAHSKILLEKNFIINKDYKCLLPQPREQSSQTRGGHNKETFMLNIETFKKFCLKAGTKKADEIHDYYIKLEETLQEVVNEESDELKIQLVIKEKELEIKDKELQKSETQLEKIRERTLLEQFGPNVQCVYYGIIDDVSDTNEKLIKFGNSNNLRSRVLQHKDTYTNFRLMKAFKVENKLQIENAIKEHPIFIEHQRNIMIKGKKYIELISLNGVTFTILDKTIKEIIITIECNPENYKKILEENKQLKKQIRSHNESNNNTTELLLLRNENKTLKIENLKLQKIKKKLQNPGLNENIIVTECECDVENEDTINIVVTDLVWQLPNDASVASQKEVENYGLVMKTLKRKRKMKERDGMFHIDGKVFEKIEGTREEVWNGSAYQTPGGLKKGELLINNKGRIVSKVKSIDSQTNDRFEESNKKRSALSASVQQDKQ